MQALIAFAPLAAFFVTYSLRGLYAATAVLMAAMLALLAFDWLRLRRIPPLHGLSTLLVLIFGAATLLFHNRLFIQWKPTVLFWLLSLAFGASFWIGERTLAQRFLAPALDNKLMVSQAQWRRLNGWSVAFYALLGALNIAVAYLASERTWVYFKMFGLALLTSAFVALQVLWLSSRAAPLPPATAPAPDTGR
jgi:intracellular septation protein